MMKTYAGLTIGEEILNHPLYLLEEAVDRLKEEHAALRKGLMELREAAQTIVRERHDEQLIHIITGLKKKVVSYMSELAAHARWEDETLFPMIAWYFGEEPEQFCAMEHGHELAEQYVLAFLGALDRAVLPIRPEAATEMASYLAQAYLVLMNHFQEEEEMIVTLADRSNAYGY
ncbi:MULTISPECIES: hemerythrin domain-containing protein [unclassified Paenibacillus]|uniref:hemerythrin domain-containing protein n=1 Tax=unclassified Paenibacillus TaxID=185978 RepID=UPI001E34E13F|nr:MULTISPECIES: hemerythrin domain-containing protein [unclassified Paenibacillus]CAH0118099.1 hypothetical protein PAE9249_00565 [Paenibacillus sp. CECT 9249]